MKKLFDKNEVIFAVILIVIYVAGSTLMVQLSEMIGTGFLAEAVFGIVLFAVLAVFIVKNRLGRHLGLCKPEVSAARMLFYIPLTIIAAVGVIFGFAPQYEPVTLAVHTVYMLFVGILEEIIFRGSVPGNGEEKYDIRDNSFRGDIRRRAYREPAERLRSC